MTHTETCRQIASVEEVPRLADCPYLRLTCVHGHSWHVTEDGAPLPAPEQRGWKATSTTALACRYCGARPLGRARKFCPKSKAVEEANRKWGKHATISCSNRVCVRKGDRRIVS